MCVFLGGWVVLMRMLLRGWTGRLKRVLTIDDDVELVLLLLIESQAPGLLKQCDC